MKILCKRSINNGKDIIKDEIYDFDYIFGDYMLVSLENSPIACFTQLTEIHLWNFFYTPEETINVLRTKLIDKMLNEKL